jgi:hypothetical protein
MERRGWAGRGRDRFLVVGALLTVSGGSSVQQLRPAAKARGGRPTGLVVSAGAEPSTPPTSPPTPEPPSWPDLLPHTCLEASPSGHDRWEGHAIPADVDVIAAAPVSLFGMPTMATMSCYTAASGAGVFSASTTYWPCQVGESCRDHAADPETSRILGTMTDNVLRSFAAGPAGLLHPSQRRLAPSAAALIASAASPHEVAVRVR